MNIECREFNLNAEDTSKMHTSGDFIVNGNNIIEKAKEQISLEGTKSIYTSTGELRENVVTRTSEIGTPTGGNIGGQSTMKVNGHFVIENLDPKGGITIKSAGYTNILTAAERIDLTGNPSVLSPRFDPTPMGKATYTHIVSANPGPTPKGVPGSSYFQCGPGGLTEVITGPVSRTNNGPTDHLFNGPFNEQYNKDKNITVLGKEIASISGIYRLSAQYIFLN